MTKAIVFLAIIAFCIAIDAATLNYRDRCEYNWCSHECRKKGHIEGECYFNHITGKTVCKCDTARCNNAKCKEKCEKQGYFNGYCPNTKDPWCQCNLASKCDIDECYKKCRSMGNRDGGFCSRYTGDCVCYL
ncbi:hypothetical protein PPYR_15292 [Photinus pyralis]|uniref:Uncharacterized protein n=1 Tax=Photinus pyralis TaxID=7054 RepID=A0A1Y1K5L5_PHOPY|nr:uncharacterized protein LOC116171533 [Photinus pyralis]KAB0790782.1 hypothetical protein PPYR_15292 [Photinus pyralis]